MNLSQLTAKDWITIGISISALLVSLSSFILSVRNFYRDRSHLKLKVTYKKEKKEFQLLVTNDGRRTAVLQEVNAKLWFHKPHSITKTVNDLTEGKQKSYSIPLAMFSDVSSPFRIRGFEVLDTHNNHYRISMVKLYWNTLFQN